MYHPVTRFSLFLFITCGAAAIPTIETDVAIVGAGYAGLAAANQIAKESAEVEFHVIEALERVGGRVRNYDLGTSAFDTKGDYVVEVGGTFVSPGHTALISLVKETGLQLYNVSKTTRFSEPPGEWPWWWFGVDSNTPASTSAVSVFHTFNQTPRATSESPKVPGAGCSFVGSTDVLQCLRPSIVKDLQQAGQELQKAVETISCSKDYSYAAATDSGKSKSKADTSHWFEADMQTFEGWMSEEVQFDESKQLLRAMTRGMIAQEPSQVSFLSILKSIKGCWSSGTDDQYRVRGGTQGPLLVLGERYHRNITLASPVRSIDYNTTDETHPILLVSDKVHLRAKKLIVTGSPYALMQIRYQPLLPANTAQLFQRMPMGTSMKYFVIYERNFWRELGFSGTIVLSKMPTAGPQDLLYCCQEHSPFSEENGAALMCWIEGLTNLHFLSGLTVKQRKSHILSFLARTFNSSLPLDLHSKVIQFNWADQPHIGGAYTGFFTPGVQSEPAFWDAYKDLSNGAAGKIPKRVWVAGSDWATGYGNGYMEGAIRSGQAAAKSVVSAFHAA